MIEKFNKKWKKKTLWLRCSHLGSGGEQFMSESQLLLQLQLHLHVVLHLEWPDCVTHVPRHTWCENNASQSGLYIVFTWEVCFSFSFSAGWERSAVLYKVWDTNYVVIIRQHARQTCPTLRPSMIIWDLEIFLLRQTESECPLSSSKYNISNHYEAGGQVSEVQSSQCSVHWDWEEEEGTQKADFDLLEIKLEIQYLFQFHVELQCVS